MYKVLTMVGSFFAALAYLLTSMGRCVKLLSGVGPLGLLPSVGPNSNLIGMRQGEKAFN